MSNIPQQTSVQSQDETASSDEFSSVSEGENSTSDKSSSHSDDNSQQSGQEQQSKQEQESSFETISAYDVKGIVPITDETYLFRNDICGAVADKSENDAMWANVYDFSDGKAEDLCDEHSVVSIKVSAQD